MPANEKQDDRILEVGDYSLSGHERDRLFQNDGSGRFVDVAYAAGVDRVEDGRALACLDANEDGAPDLVFNHRLWPTLHLNRNPAGARFLNLRLRGTASNRDAIGARVTLVRESGSREVQFVKCGSGHFSQNTRTLFFGMGHATNPARVDVVWPNGSPETFRDLPIGEVVSLVEGAGVPAPGVRAPRPPVVDPEWRIERDRHDEARRTPDPGRLADLPAAVRDPLRAALGTAEIRLVCLLPDVAGKDAPAARSALETLARVVARAGGRVTAAGLGASPDRAGRPDLAARGHRLPGTPVPVFGACRGDLSAFSEYALEGGPLLIGFDRADRVRLHATGPLHEAQLVRDLDEIRAQARNAPAATSGATAR